MLDDGGRSVAEVQVQADVHVRTNRLAEGLDLAHDDGEVAAFQVAVHGLGEVVGLARMQRVGFERGISAAYDLVSQVGQVGPGVDGRGSENVRVACPIAAAVRPIHADALAGGAAQQFGDRDAQGLALDVPERRLDTSQRLTGDATHVLAHAKRHVGCEGANLSWVLANDVGGQVMYAGRQGARHLPVAALAVAD